MIEGAGLTTEQQSTLKQEYLEKVSEEEGVSQKKWEVIKKGIEDTPNRRAPENANTTPNTPTAAAPPDSEYLHEPRWFTATKYNKKTHKPPAQATTSAQHHPIRLSQVDYSRPPPPFVPNHPHTGGRPEQAPFHRRRNNKRWKKNPV